MTDLSIRPAVFARYILGYQPFPYQTAFLDDPSSRIIVASGRQSGKTDNAAAKAIYEAIFNPGTNVLVLAPTYFQSSETYNRIRNLLRGSEFTKRSIVKDTKTCIELTNGSKIYNLTVGNSGDHIRSLTKVSCVVVDEAAFLRCDDTERLIHQVIEPMLWVNRGKLILLSSPWGRRGIFWKAWAGATGESHDPAYAGYSAHRWKSYYNPLVRDEVLQELKTPGYSDSIAWRQEREAEFVDSTGLFWSRELIDRMLLSDTSEPAYCDLWERIPNFAHVANTESFYAGIDWAFSSSTDADRTVFTIVSKNPDTETVRLRHIKVFDKGTSPADIEDYVLTADDKLNFEYVLSDTGIGKGSIDRLSDAGVTIEPYAFTQQSKMDLYGFWLDLAETGSFRMPNCTELLHEMSTFELELKNYGKWSVHHSPGAHDDLMDSCALAVFASKSASATWTNRLASGLHI